MVQDSQAEISPDKTTLHSNGFELQDIEDGWFTVTGQGIISLRLEGLTAEVRREGQEHYCADFFEPYVLLRYFNSQERESINASEGRLEIAYQSYIDTTLSQLQVDFQYWNGIWKASEACTKLQDQIATLAKQSEHRIHNIVGFAIGTFHDSSLGNRSRSHLQLAILLTIKSALETSSPSPVRCYMQDPVLSSLDTELLRYHGVEKLDDPKGFAAINHDTLVYTVAAYDFVYRKISQGPRPAMLLCDTLDVTIEATAFNNHDDGSGLSEAEIKALKDIFLEYEEKPIPDAIFNIPEDQLDQEEQRNKEEKGGQEEFENQEEFEGHQGQECHWVLDHVVPLGTATIYWRKPQGGR